MEQRIQDDVRYPGRGEVPDWHAWARRIDHLAERIAAARAAGADHPQALTEAVPASTRRVYTADMKAFGAWCEVHGRVPLPAPPRSPSTPAT
ncbi:hypothetical protein AB0L65_40435 [Nonomuraea sp. NPDC052116]|uniref:hypothetical protein n=1 Tax=Nonomuraea sp. NPDC052116 TaxID=3155665 RepID=UPI003424FF85